MVQLSEEKSLKIEKMKASQILEDISTRAAFDHSIKLGFDDCTISVKTNSKKLHEKLISYYEPYIPENTTERTSLSVIAYEREDVKICLPLKIRRPDRKEKRPKEEYCNLDDGRIIRKIETGMVFTIGKGVNIAIGPCCLRSNQVVNFINNRFIEWKIKRGYLLMHSAGVEVSGRGFAIAGQAGAGKSTLALRLLNEGLGFVSNDRVLAKRFEEDVMMNGIPKFPRINPGTALTNEKLKHLLSDDVRNMAIDMTTERLWDLELKCDVDIKNIYGNECLIKGSIPMKGMVVLNWKREDIPTVAETTMLSERFELIKLFEKTPGLFYTEDSESEKLNLTESTYMSALRDIPLLLLEGGADFDAAVEECTRFFDERRG